MEDKRLWKCVISDGSATMSMLDLGGACEMDSIFCVWYFMHSRLLSYIVLYVIYVWFWNLCDMCALYFDIYVMSLCYAYLLCFRVLLNTNELYFVYSYVFHILWVHCVGLDHISMPNPFCSYCQLLIWTKHVKNLTHLLYMLEVVLSSITKKG